MRAAPLSKVAGFRARVAWGSGAPDTGEPSSRVRVYADDRCNVSTVATRIVDREPQPRSEQGEAAVERNARMSARRRACEWARMGTISQLTPAATPATLAADQEKKPPLAARFLSGAYRDRTGDPLLAKQVLSHLS